VLTDTLTINYPVDLRLVSDVVNAPVDELMALNPSLLRLVTPPDAPFDLHLPGGMAAVYEQRIAAIPEGKRNAWRYHRIQHEDTLESVAREYRVTESALAAANQLSVSDSVTGVDALVIPTAPAAAPAAHTLLYTVRKGETLVTISDRFGVSLNQLRRWNKIAGIKVQPGQRLHVADPSTLPHTVSRTHRRGASRSDASEREAAPTKGATATGASKKSRASTARRAPAHSSNAAPGANKSKAASAEKFSTRKRAASSKAHSTK
jgi:membrane-bound lytic murein transglycosylase D